uniref:Septenin 1b n=1 Tax=Osteopilus septentrionalis TaxID=317373 RepID=SEP1B_OSTSE|nr:RecName: Full=Septenin 1b [Osteopilus septentrionalis]
SDAVANGVHAISGVVDS